MKRMEGYNDYLPLVNRGLGHSLRGSLAAGTDGVDRLLKPTSPQPIPAPTAEILNLRKPNLEET